MSYVTLCVNAAEAMDARTIPGNYKIKVKAYTRDGQAVIEFSDTGKGIPEENIPRIFELLWTSGKVGGTGVGLALVKEAVSRLGGTIGVTSQVGVGTTFTIRLPAESPAHEQVRQLIAQRPELGKVLDRIREKLKAKDPEETVGAFLYITRIYDTFKNILSETRAPEEPRYVFMPLPKALREIASDADREAARKPIEKSLRDAWLVVKDILKPSGFNNVNVAFYDGTMEDLNRTILRMSKRKGTVNPKNGLAYVDKNEAAKLNSYDREKISVTFVKEIIPPDGGRFSIGGHVVLALGVLDLINNDRVKDSDYWTHVLDLVRKISNNDNKYKDVTKEAFIDKIYKEELEIDLPPIERETMDRDIKTISITEREVGSSS